MKNKNKPIENTNGINTEIGRADTDENIIPGISTPGINTPGIELPAFNPPIPNRAWTAMRNGQPLDALTEEEKSNLYFGK